MAGYIGSKTSVTQVDGYNRTEADDEFVSKDGDTITTAAGTALTLDRTGSDGTILDLKKDGSTVGSIGAFGGTTVIDSGSSYSGLGFDGSVIYPRKARATSDGTVDLGASNARWKDLYLSGGAYLGGTGSANRLNSYEEGTFTPSILGYYGTNPVISYNNQQGTYVKVGDLVHVDIRIDIQSASNLSGDLIMAGPLPFAIRSGVEAEGVSNTSAWSPQRGNHISSGCHSITQSHMGFLTSNPGSGWGWEPTSIMPTGASALRISMTYIAA